MGKFLWMLNDPRLFIVWWDHFKFKFYTYKAGGSIVYGKSEKTGLHSNPTTVLFFSEDQPFLVLIYFKQMLRCFFDYLG